MPAQGEQAVSHVFHPAPPAHQGMVQGVLGEGHGVMNFADLHQLQQHRALGQVGDDDFGLFFVQPLNVDMQFRGPLALKLLACQLQALVCGRRVAQGGARQYHRYQGSYNRRQQGNEAKNGLQRRVAEPGDPVHIRKRPAI